jgi:hypothetical protein
MTALRQTILVLLRILKNKEAVEQRVDIMAAGHVTGTWLLGNE